MDDVNARSLDSTVPIEPTSWAQAAPLLGMKLAELNSRPVVAPFLTWFKYVAPDMTMLNQLLGKQGRMAVRVSVLPSGRAGAVQITSGSGNPLMDRIGVYVMERSHWLPGMSYGQPVAHDTDLDLVFDNASVNDRTLMQAGAGGDGWAPMLNGYDARPDATPGGAGQVPGSW
jgi:hypothetical protein